VSFIYRSPSTCSQQKLVMPGLVPGIHVLTG
jgi:hypothetical protein